MQRSVRRLLILLLSLALLIVASAGLYMVGMATLEDEERGFWRSLAWAGETLSTTGYGADSDWSHPVMVLFVVALQFIGVLLVFLLFPVYIIPALEERFQSRLPRAAPKTEDTILILRYGATVSTLIEEIELEGLEPLIVESDETVARELIEQGRRVVHGSLVEDVLSRIELSGVLGVVANGSDDENATAILTLRQMGYEGDIYALVEEPYHRKPVTLAGATGVFTPRHILAAALAARASDKISPRVEGAQALGRKLIVSELKIGRHSPIEGKSLREADLSQNGVTVIGTWLHGKLIAPPNPDVALEAGTILVVAGKEENLQRFAEHGVSGRLRTDEPFFVAGYGEVGRTMTELLKSVGERVTVLDRRELPGVDIVGDIADHKVLESSPLRDAQAVVIAVGSDSATLFATLMVRDFAPHVPILARVNQVENVERIHRAGADFALSVGQVSGQLLAARLLRRESISIDQQLRILGTEATKLANRHPRDLEIRQRMGVSVVAVERDDDISVDFGDDFRFRDRDIVYVAGSYKATQEFMETFGSAT